MKKPAFAIRGSIWNVNETQSYSLILGATRGLGKAIAEECHRQEWNTIGVGSSIRNFKSKNRTLYRCNLEKGDDVKKLIKKLDKKDLVIDHFFWVAGKLLKGSFSTQTQEEITNIIDVNFRNSILVAQAIWKQMETAGSRRTFTVIASTSGIRHRNDEAVYVATKFAQVGFTRSLAAENTNSNVKISLFLPGGMDTEMREAFPKSKNKNLLKPGKVTRHMVERIARQRKPFIEELIERGTL